MRQGLHTEGKRHFERRYTLAQEVGDVAASAAALINLGIVS